MTDALVSPILANYQTRLPFFEGPLDVLLRLIERDKLDITDVSLVQVTDQFIDYMRSLTEAPGDVIAEFAAVGARLTVLKSRSLLPRPPKVEEEAEPDPDDLVMQLRAYKRLKDAARLLEERHLADIVTFHHQGTGAISAVRHVAETRLAQHDPAWLVRAIKRRMSTVPAVTQTIRQRRVRSIREMIERITTLSRRRNTFWFSNVVYDARTRSDRATAFLAMLVLIRRNALEAHQTARYADISLSPVSDQLHASDTDEFTEFDT